MASEETEPTQEISPETGRKRGGLWALLVLLFLAIAGAGGYLGFQHFITQQAQHAPQTDNALATLDKRLAALETFKREYDELMQYQGSLTPDMPVDDAIAMLREEMAEEFSCSAEAFAHDDMRMERIEKRIDALVQTASGVTAVPFDAAPLEARIAALETRPSPAVATATEDNSQLAIYVLLQQALDNGRPFGKLLKHVPDAPAEWQRYEGTAAPSLARMIAWWEELHLQEMQEALPKTEQPVGSGKTLWTSIQNKVGGLVTVKKLDAPDEASEAPALPTFSNEAEQFVYLIHWTAKQETISDEMDLWLDNARDRLNAQGWLDSKIAEELAR